MVICGSDLLLLNSHWDFAHVDAFLLNIPTLVFGNSVQQELNLGQTRLTSTFSPDIFLYELIQLMVQINQNGHVAPLFQYISYPIKQIELPPCGLQEGIPPYHLADMFNDLETFPLLEKLICDPQYLLSYAQLCNKYLKREHSALTMQTILNNRLK